MSRSKALVGGAIVLAGAGSCTVVAVQSQDNPVGLRADGLVDGHAVIGWRDERKVVRAELFDGSSPGAIAELALWKLARIEIGLAGVSLGLGPFDVGLGVIWYDPIVPVASTRKPAAKARAAEAIDVAPSVAPSKDSGAPAAANGDTSDAAVPRTDSQRS